MQVRKAMLCYLSFLLRTKDVKSAAAELNCTAERLEWMRQEANDFIDMHQVKYDDYEHKLFADSVERG